VLEGGSGCAEVEGKEDRVSVTGTRGCCKASGLKWLNTGNADPTWAPRRRHTRQNVRRERRLKRVALLRLFYSKIPNLYSYETNPFR
jgi:hypothetical protein